MSQKWNARLIWVKNRLFKFQVWIERNGQRKKERTCQSGQMYRKKFKFAWYFISIFRSKRKPKACHKIGIIAKVGCPKKASLLMPLIRKDIGPWKFLIAELSLKVITETMIHSDTSWKCILHDVTSPALLNRACKICGFPVAPKTYLSHLVTKPTKWLCAQRRLRSA